MAIKRHTIPLTAVAGGAAALALRLWNLRAGFEPATGLPVSHPSFPALLALFGAVMLALLLQARGLSDGGAPRFPFRAQNSAPCVPAVAGMFLLALSGIADLYEGAAGESVMDRLAGAAPTYQQYHYAGMISAEAVGMGAGAQCACGLLALLSAWAVFECVRACLRGDLKSRALVMLPAVALSFRLVAVYRIDSVNPVLQDYAPALVALMFQVLGFYCFSAFAFDSGDLTAFAVSAGGAICAAMCVLADETEYVSSPLTLCGSASALAGFLMLALQAPPAPRNE